MISEYENKDNIQNMNINLLKNVQNMQTNMQTMWILST
jgi:hypothetical protein